MNYADSERVATVLEQAGYKKALHENEADLIIVTMCSIRQSAVDRVHWLIEKFKRRRNLQTTNYKLQTVLTGCILEKDKKVFAQGFDYVIDIKNVSQLPKLLKQTKKAKLLYSQENQNTHSKNQNYLDITPKHSSKFSANVPIMTGCNNFCAYCVVPYTREREISRPAKKIVAEIKNLVKKDYKEIWLLGQNVNSYKSPRHCEELASDEAIQNDEIASTTTAVGSRNDGFYTFAELLLEINKIKGDFWVRYTSSHPKDFKDDVILAMADLPTKAEENHITPYLNLPVQSGDDKVLKSMKRFYTVKHYRETIKKLRQKIPQIGISTDIIVGFPGETKKQFENTAKLFREIKYDMAYINKYSPRAGTASAKLNDNVSWPEKKRREKVLTDILRKTAFANNKKLIGKNVKVLIYSKKIDNKNIVVFFGKTDTYKSIRVIARSSQATKQSRRHVIPNFDCPPAGRQGNPKIGQFVTVKITKAHNWNLEGKII